MLILPVLLFLTVYYGQLVVGFDQLRRRLEEDAVEKVIKNYTATLQTKACKVFYEYQPKDDREEERTVETLSFLTSDNTNFNPVFEKKTETINYSWVSKACPAVAEYFKKVPYFKFYNGVIKGPIVLTTEAAQVSVCLLSVVDKIMKEIGGEGHWFIHAGTHLGAVLHGSPIPWDDDMDIAIDKAFEEAFVKRVRETRIEGMPLGLARAFNADKLWVNGPGTFYQTRGPWGWPMIDIFYLSQHPTDHGHLYEVGNMTGTPALNFHRWKKSVLYPLRKYFYAGLMLPGPSLEIATRRYNFHRCVAPAYHHRSENRQYCRVRPTANTTNRGMSKWISIQDPAVGCDTEFLDCCKLSNYFPFVHYITHPVHPENTIELVYSGTGELVHRQTALENRIPQAKMTWLIPHPVARETEEPPKGA